MTPDAIAANITRIRGRIERACDRAGRDPSSVTLIGVTKQQPADAVLAAINAGLTHFGENRVQEALAKIEALRQLAPLTVPKCTFHLIGHLQTNKARAAVGAFGMLHIIDSERIAAAIADAATAPVPCFLEVNVAGEETKFGVSPAGVPALMEACRAHPTLNIVGLMTVAPPVSKPGEVRPVFRQLAQLAAAEGLPMLSMGMTHDFEVAIEEGATHVRIGRAIFGERQFP